jgi:replicative DNA helicase
MKTRNGRAYPKCILRTIVIDSIQNMLPPPGASNRSRQVEVQAISRSVLNDVCKACKVSTIGLVQLNRGIDSQKERRPQLKDIREAGDIEYDADEILFVHREQYYLRENTPPELRNIADIVHGKGRSGIDLESAPARLWFAGGMFFDGPAEGWAAWEEKHGQRGT